jgi:hypothetical protein
VPKHSVRNPGGPASDLTSDRQARTVNPRGTTVMYGCRESDSPIVSRKPSNKGSGAPELAEGVERRGLAKGNLVGFHRGRTQSRVTLSQAHDWVRQARSACAFDPRQEPGAVVPHAGICAGGVG